MEYQKTLNGKSKNKDLGIPITRNEVNRRLDKYINILVENLRKAGPFKIFPIGENNEAGNIKGKELPEQVSNTLRTNYSSGFSNETYVQEESVTYNDKEKRKDDMND